MKPNLHGSNAEYRLARGTNETVPSAADCPYTTGQRCDKSLIGCLRTCVRRPDRQDLAQIHRDLPPVRRFEE